MAFEFQRNGTVVFATAGIRPFVTAVRREKEYRANRGTVKTTVVERERIALDAIHEDGDVVTFSGGGHSITMTVRDVACGV